MAVINKTSKNKCRRGCGEKGPLTLCCWECKLIQLLQKTVWCFLKKLGIELPHDPATALLSTSLKNLRTFIHKGICTAVFPAALFMVASTWRPLKCPSRGDWIKREWCVYTVGSYSAIREDEILPFATTRVDLENTVLSENHMEKVKKDFTLGWDICTIVAFL